jgi:hypothetical protein
MGLNITARGCSEANPSIALHHTTGALVQAGQHSAEAFAKQLGGGGRWVGPTNRFCSRYRAGLDIVVKHTNGTLSRIITRSLHPFVFNADGMDLQWVIAMQKRRKESYNSYCKIMAD